MVFSIILPVYNAARTLERCLESIQNQTFSDYEVILVDDGSTDRSREICERFAGRNPCVTVLHQENSGPSAARNRAMSAAAGRYLCFVDSDDYIGEQYLEELYKEITRTGADIVFFGYFRVFAGGKRLSEVVPSGSFPTKYDLADELAKQDAFGYTWCRCVSAGAAEGSSFRENMKLFEDEVFICEILAKEVTVSVLPLPLYYYCVNDAEQLSSRTNPDYCLLSDQVFGAWKELLQKAPDYEDLITEKANAFVSRCIYYGLEHAVPVRNYFGELSETEFFRMHSSRTRLDPLIRSEKWMAIAALKRKYLLKQSLAAAGKRLFRH